jgi:hypothetical protein
MGTFPAGSILKTIIGFYFHIDISKDGDKIKISGYERLEGEQKTVSHYEEVKIEDARILAYQTEVIGLLNRANKRGRINKDILNKLKSVGQLLFDEIFSPEIKKKLKNTDAQDMVINMDEQMVGIPWPPPFRSVARCSAKTKARQSSI